VAGAPRLPRVLDSRSTLAYGTLHYNPTCFHVQVGHTEQIVRALADGVAMLGVVTQALAAGAAGLVTLARFREPLVAVVAPAHPLAGMRGLAVESFIARADPFYPVRWGTLQDERIARAAREDEPETALPHEMVRLLVARGRDGALFPLSFAQEDLDLGRLVAVPLADDEVPMRDLAVVHLARGAALSRSALDFEAAIRDEARAHLIP
jgi:DNA-binding transcriptional LysR family regulator